MASGPFVCLAVIPVIVFLFVELIIFRTPLYTGVLNVPHELDSEVTIIRDDMAVPTIKASSINDAAFAEGVLHGQERLWQIDVLRKLMAGRLAEWVGEAVVPIDKFNRLLGFKQVCEQDLTMVKPQTIKLLEAYAAGINYASETFRLPLEYSIFWVDFEPWTPMDSCFVMKGAILGLTFSGAEAMRNALIDLLGAERTEELFPHKGDVLASITPTIIRNGELNLGDYKIPPEMQITPRPGEEARFVPPKDSKKAESQKLDDNRSDVGVQRGSNSWVISGKYTVDGKPLLANDPHLNNSTPSTWYMINIVVSDVDNYFQGMSFPGTPLGFIGRTKLFDWTITAGCVDLLDYYVMTLNDEGDQYYHDGQWKKLDIRKETLQVRGGEQVELEVKSSHLGTIMNEGFTGLKLLALSDQPADQSFDLPMAMNWTGEEASATMDSFLDIISAKTTQDFMAIWENHRAPLLNLVFVNKENDDIAYISAGSIPIRTHEGTYPVDGSLKENDPVGTIPPKQMPRIINPERGFIVTANNKVISEDYPYPLHNQSWGMKYRAARITTLIEKQIEAGVKFSVQDMVDFQNDNYEILADLPLKRMLQLITPDINSLPKLEKAMVSKLLKWDAICSEDSIAASVFRVWLHETLRIMLQNHLPDETIISQVMNYWTIDDFILLHFKDLQDSDFWCDNSKTTEAETCSALLIKSLGIAGTVLTEKLGDNMSSWQLKNLITSTHPHLPGSEIPGIKSIFHLEYGRGGSSNAPNVALMNRYSREYKSMGSANMKMVMNSNTSESAEKSLWGIDTGQSGHPYSPHYNDFLLRFRDSGTALLDMIPPVDNPNPGKEVLILRFE